MENDYPFVRLERKKLKPVSLSPKNPKLRTSPIPDVKLRKKRIQPLKRSPKNAKKEAWKVRLGDRNKPLKLDKLNITTETEDILSKMESIPMDGSPKRLKAIVPTKKKSRLPKPSRKKIPKIRSSFDPNNSGESTGSDEDKLKISTRVPINDEESVEERPKIDETKGDVEDQVEQEKPKEEENPLQNSFVVKKNKRNEIIERLKGKTKVKNLNQKSSEKDAKRHEEDFDLPNTQDSLRVKIIQSRGIIDKLKNKTK